MNKPEQPAAMLPEPVRPEDWECCGSDCGDACIWQIYYRDQAAWAAQQQAQALAAKPENDT